MKKFIFWSTIVLLIFYFNTKYSKSRHVPLFSPEHQESSNLGINGLPCFTCPIQL